MNGTATRTGIAVSVCVALACSHHEAARPNLAKPPAPPSPPTYPIQLVRSDAANVQRHVIADVKYERRITTTKPGEPTTKETHRRVIHFNATATSLEVQDGEATRIRYDIDDLVDDGEQVYRGAVELSRSAHAEGVALTTSKGPLEADIAEPLRHVVEPRFGTLSDDEVFGSPRPQAIGAHWPVNVKLELARLTTKDWPGVGSATGDVWLEGLTNVAGVDCSDVRARIEFNDVKLATRPPGSIVDSSRLVVELSGMYPTNLSLTPLKHTRRVMMSARLRVPAPAGDTTIEVDGDDVTDLQFLPLPNESKIRALNTAARACYTRALAAAPQMAGNLNVAVTIDGSGRILEVRKSSGTGLTPEVEQCVLDQFRGVTFDPPGGSGVTIGVPLRFERKNAPSSK